MWFLVRPDAVKIWKVEEVCDRLRWYHAVMENKMPAKYRIVKRISATTDPKTLTLKELWKEHNELEKDFIELWSKVRNNEVNIENKKIPRHSFLDVKIEIVKRLLKSCIFCERRCRVDRTKGIKGVCGLTSESRVSSAFLHLGEEAPLVPSGTIFFTGCSFKCVFCQNWEISQFPRNGEVVTPKELALIATNLRKRGARNINYVGGNPDQHLHVVVESLKFMDINVPLLWNSNFYMTQEAMKILVHLIDIWLPDFKYGNNKCALRFSAAPNYLEIVTRNLKIACQWGDIIIRHLVLPGHIECCTQPVLEWISRNCPHALVNIMGQYRPEYLVARYPEKWPEIARRPSINEMREAFRIAEELGIAYKHVS
ncbi:MAG TPA: radical SAM protein [Thermoproteales archaeon]|nr:radical SAM protein [Thermoproteales archaeon]